MTETKLSLKEEFITESSQEEAAHYTTESYREKHRDWLGLKRSHGIAWA